MSQVIPEAAVEAAFARIAGNLDDTETESWKDLLRLALEAAAPHMRQAFYLEMNLRAVEDELRAAPIYPLGKIEDKR